MGKEVKIGLAVIGVLLCVFGGVLFFRLRREAPETAQKNIAATKKEPGSKLAKSSEKGSANSGKSAEGLSLRLAGKNRVQISSGDADSDAGNPEATRNRAPALETSAYRNRSKDTRRGRYGDISSAETDSNEANADEAEQSGAEQGDMGLSELSMPGDRFGRQPRDLAVSDDDQSDNSEAANGADDVPESTAEKRYSDNRYAQDHYAQDLQERGPDEAESGQADDEQADGGHASDGPAEDGYAQDRYAQNLARNRRYGEQTLDGGTDDPAGPAEPEDAMRLSPLDDRTEVRPAAAARDSQGRYEENQSEGDSFDPGQSDGEEVGGGQFARDGGRTHKEEMTDDTESAASEPVEESPAPLRPESDSYVVEPNDNFWRISQKVYGTGAYFKALEEHNRRQYGDKRLINVGDVLSVPPLATLRENYSNLCPKPRNAPAGRETSLSSASARGGRGTHTYTVSEGDTLFDIARNELGKASRWAEIYRLNQEQLGEDFNYLSPGMRLVLPARDDQTDPIASRPRREGYRR